MKDVLSEMAIFEKFGGRKANPFFELLQGRFLINFAYRFQSPLGGLAETRVAFGGPFSSTGVVENGIFAFLFKNGRLRFY